MLEVEGDVKRVAIWGSIWFGLFAGSLGVFRLVNSQAGNPDDPDDGLDVVLHRSLDNLPSVTHATPVDNASMNEAIRRQILSNLRQDFRECKPLIMSRAIHDKEFVEFSFVKGRQSGHLDVHLAEPIIERSTVALDELAGRCLLEKIRMLNVPLSSFGKDPARRVAYRMCFNR